MVHRRSGLTLFLMFLVISLLTDSLLAGPTGTLTGRVTDPSGGVIAGVKVEATNVETNVVFTGETNAEGLYNIPNLPPGTYRVIVQKFAFRTVVKPGVELHVQAAANEHAVASLRDAERSGLCRNCAGAGSAVGPRRRRDRRGAASLRLESRVVAAREQGAGCRAEKII